MIGAGSGAARALVAALAAFTAVLAVRVAVLGGPPSLTEVIDKFRRDHDLPGVVVAFGPAGGEPVLAALGFADPVRRVPMGAMDEFYIASLAKPLTAAAILALEKEGALSRDDPVGRHLALPAAADPRIADVSLAALMAHTGGFALSLGFDPLLAPERLGLDPGAGCGEVADAVLGARPLDYAPQTRQVYSNLGYCLLSRVIGTVGANVGANVGGGDLSAALRRLTGVAQLAPGRPGLRHWRREGTGWRPLYQDDPDAKFFARLAGAGGWQTTAEAYWRFAARPHEARLAPPPKGASGNDYYALGWRVWRGPDGVQLTHSGFLPGIFTVAATFSNGMVVVALFNGGVRDGLAAFLDLFDRLCAAQGLTCRA